MSKYLDLKGVEHLWGKIKESITDATTGTIPADRLQLKTINGQSIKGTGDITIDLSLYKVVETLPSTAIDANKIYLVVDAKGQGNNVYKEYIYVNGKFELVGEFKADIDLSPYVKFADVATTTKAGAMSATDKNYLDNAKNYLYNQYTLALNEEDFIQTTQETLSIKTAFLDSEGAVDFNAYTIPNATSTTAGVMSADDKKHLDNTIQDIQFVNATIINAGGQEEVNPNWHSTDFIKLNKSYDIIVVGASGTVPNVYFYDANKQPISYKSSNSESRITFTVAKADFPENAVYFKACCDNYGLRYVLNDNTAASAGTFLRNLMSASSGSIANIALKSTLNNYFNLNTYNSIKGNNAFEKTNNFKNTQRFYSSIELASNSSVTHENGTIYRIQYCDYNGENNTFRGSEVLDMKYDSDSNAILHFSHGSGDLHTKEHFFQAEGFKVNNGTGSNVLIDNGGIKAISSATTSYNINNTYTPNDSIPNISAIKYWNGAYSEDGTTLKSCLQYCDKGKFGDIVTKNSEEFISKSVYDAKIKELEDNINDLIRIVTPVNL